MISRDSSHTRVVRQLNAVDEASATLVMAFVVSSGCRFSEYTSS